MKAPLRVVVAALVGFTRVAGAQSVTQPADIQLAKYNIIMAYLDSARALGDRGRADSALLLLTNPPKNHPLVPAGSEFLKDELAADKAFYAGKMKHPVPIAVSDQAKPMGFPNEFNTVNTNRYGVQPIPQIVLIDRQGIVRRIFIGYEAATWEMPPTLVAALMAEK